MKDKSLDEIFNNLYIWDNSADGAIKTENSLNNAKQQILALKSKWETEARIDELKQLWNKTQPDIIPEGVEPSNFSGSCILVRLKELGDK